MSKEPEKTKFKTMSLGDHLEELRYRLILAIAGLMVGLIACLFFGAVFLRFISEPYEFAMLQAGLEPILIAIQPAEKFVMYIKVSLLFGLIFSSPWVFYHLWTFISTGLYPKERKYIYFIVPASAGLFIAGAIFFIKVVAPLTMLFFVKFNPGVEFVKVSFTLRNYLNFVVGLTIIFGLGFQMPIAIICAERLGIISIQQLNNSRKFVILLLIIIAAMATPPDVISQLALAVPLYALFEVGILVCWLLGRKK